MNKITLAQAHQILTNSRAVIWDDDKLCYPSLSELTGEDDNEFLYLSITDDEGLEWSAKFQESNNKEVRFEGSSLFMMDDEGEEVQISILMPCDVRGLLNNSTAEDDRCA